MCAAECGRGERKYGAAEFEAIDDLVCGCGGGGGSEGDANRAACWSPTLAGDAGDNRPPAPRRGFLIKDARTGDDAETFAGNDEAATLFHWNRRAVASSPSATEEETNATQWFR